MLKHWPLPLLCVLVQLTGAAQGTGFTYTSPEEIPQEYRFDPFGYYSSIVETGKEGQRKKHIKRWAEIAAFGKSNLFESGNVYLKWGELEGYLNDILSEMRKENHGLENIHVYATRNPYINAFSTHDGALFFNIGLLAEAQDEAALASVMGHEIAHYLNHDPENSFYNKLVLYTKKHRNDNYELSIEKAHDDREQEAIADKQGFRMALISGYDLQSAYSNFYLFLDLDKKSDAKSTPKRGLSTASSKKKEKDLGLLTSHPETMDRIYALDSFIKENPQQGAKKFIVSQEKFEKLKALAKIESLKRLLHFNHNLEAFDKALSYHLFDTSNKDYLYYMLESLRRHLFLNERDRDEPVFADLYPNYIEEGTWDELLEVIVRDSALLEKVQFDPVKAGFEKETLPTYEKFMVYLERLVNQRKLTEGYLSLALYYINSEQERVFYLDKYLSSGSPKRVAYVSALSTNNFLNDIGHDRHLLLFDEVDFIEDRYYGYRNKMLYAREQNEGLYETVKQTVIEKHFPTREAVPINELRKNNLRMYEELVALIDNLIYVNNHISPTLNSGSKEDEAPTEIYFEGDESLEVVQKTKEEEPAGTIYKKNIFLYNPELWEIYSRYKIKTFEYVTATAFDDKTSIAGSFLYLLSPGRYMDRLIKYGSERYSYRAQYLYADLVSHSVSHSRNTVFFRFRKPHLANTVYHLMSEAEKERKRQEKKVKQ